MHLKTGMNPISKSSCLSSVSQLKECQALNTIISCRSVVLEQSTVPRRMMRVFVELSAHPYQSRHVILHTHFTSLTRTLHRNIYLNLSRFCTRSSRCTVKRCHSGGRRSRNETREMTSVCSVTSRSGTAKSDSAFFICLPPILSHATSTNESKTLHYYAE